MKRPDEDRFLKCKLDDAELRLKGDRLAEAIKTLDRLDAEKKAFNSAHKVKQDDASSRALSLAEEVEHREEIRPVACYWMAETHKWVCIRRDTGEVVDEQAITAADRQETLGFAVAAIGGTEKN